MPWIDDLNRQRIITWQEQHHMEFVKEATQTRKALEKRASHPSSTARVFSPPTNTNANVSLSLSLSLSLSRLENVLRPLQPFSCLSSHAAERRLLSSQHYKNLALTMNLFSPFSPGKSPPRCTSTFATHGVRRRVTSTLNNNLLDGDALHTLLFFFSQLYFLGVISYLSLSVTHSRRLH